MDCKKCSDTYREMYETLRENVIIASSFLENDEYELCWRRLKMGLQKADQIHITKNYLQW